MYTIDDLDRVTVLAGIPAHSVGAPMPLVLADDARLLLSYEVAPDGHEVALLGFARSRAHYFGAPNDEALKGHPLAARGLVPYGVFEILSSSWIRLLERMNRVHHLHDKRGFERLRHFIFTFHDNTFECVAENVTVVERVANEPAEVQELFKRMIERSTSAS